MTDLRDVIRDLTTEGEQVDALVSDLDDAGWALPTPAAGWSVRHQIAHLSFIFKIAALSAAEPRVFAELAEASMTRGFDAAVNAALDDYLGDPNEVLLNRWRAERDAGIKALADHWLDIAQAYRGPAGEGRKPGQFKR